MILHRHFDKEIMDDLSIRDQRIDQALKELDQINTFLGGYSVSFEGVGILLRIKNLKGTLHVLDIGAGGSDFFIRLKKRRLRERKYNHNPNIRWTSVDLNFRACSFDKKRSAGNNVVCSDALKLPFKKESFDIVHTSLFLHHFTEKEILEILKAVRLISRSGIVINDLRRNILAYLGIKVLTGIFSHSIMVMHDGPLSVKRSFIKEELVGILHKAGIHQYIIKRKWAFRWMIVIPLP